MAINDISLTTGMRSNLLSLQNTVTLLNRTQDRLSSGKKVNSAIDNPTSYFEAQSLTNRASTIDSLKDAMGQAVSTINSADKGITSITSMIEQAKGIAQSALSADQSSGVATGSVTLTGIAAGDSVVIGGATFTATTAATPGTDEFTASGNDTIDKYSLAAAVNGHTWGATTFAASVTNGVLSLSSTTTATGATRAIVGGDFAANGGNTGTASMALVAGTSELSNLQDEYNQVLTQIDSLATDSGYKGKNLLAADTLTVKFEGTHTLDVVGFNASSGNLGITAATWTTGGSIDTDVTKLDAATSTLSQNSSKLSANLSIITTRQDFSTNMENTLTAGADKLTLADTNEEGANMLMLQTRQSLATTALSLSAQAAQSVLKLFQ